MRCILASSISKHYLCHFRWKLGMVSCYQELGWSGTTRSSELTYKEAVQAPYRIWVYYVSNIIQCNDDSLISPNIIGWEDRI